MSQIKSKVIDTLQAIRAKGKYPLFDHIPRNLIYFVENDMRGEFDRYRFMMELNRHWVNDPKMMSASRDNNKLCLYIKNEVNTILKREKKQAKMYDGAIAHPVKKVQSGSVTGDRFEP